LLAFHTKMNITNYQKQKMRMLSQLKNQLTDIQHKLSEDTFGWTVKI
jgi:hypothetical protein